MSKRIDQLNSLVQREVAELLRRHAEWPLGTLVTVTKVAVADDAESAKVWLSVLPVNQETIVEQIIKSRTPTIQTLLNKKLVMKFVPKLTFIIDRTEQKAEKINRALDQIKHEDKSL